MHRKNTRNFICLIAKRFADVAMKLALTDILSNYQVEPCERTIIPITFSKGAFIIVPANEMWLRLKLIAAGGGTSPDHL